MLLLHLRGDNTACQCTASNHTGMESPSLAHVSYFCVQPAPALTPAPAAAPKPEEKLSKSVKVQLQAEE